MEGYYVHYGCWKDAPEGWLNYDCSPYLIAERLVPFGSRIFRMIRSDWDSFPKNVRFGDIVKGLPLPDSTAKAVYCSHVLEHLSLMDFRLAIRNTHRMLISQGTFRMVLPDLAYWVVKYAENQTAESAVEFMNGTGLGEVVRDRGVKEWAREMLGGSRHRWMWDYLSIERELIESGFTEIRRAYLGDSSDPMFVLVERPERWENCLGVECVKAPQEA